MQRVVGNFGKFLPANIGSLIGCFAQQIKSLADKILADWLLPAKDFYRQFCNSPLVVTCTLITAHYYYRESTANIDWTVAHSSFPILVQLLSFNTYTYHALLGMIASVGGLTESTVSYQ